MYSATAYISHHCITRNMSDAYYVILCILYLMLRFLKAALLWHCCEGAVYLGQIPSRTVQLTDSNFTHSDPSFTQLLTQVLPTLVLVDVDVDFFDCKESSCERSLVRVRLRGGTQQLHQQQRVPHHPLHWLDEEGAQVNVVCAAPGKLGQRRCNRFQSSSAPLN